MVARFRQRREDEPCGGVEGFRGQARGNGNSGGSSVMRCCEALVFFDFKTPVLMRRTSLSEQN